MFLLDIIDLLEFQREMEGLDGIYVLIQGSPETPFYEQLASQVKVIH